jgi:lipopolysaccharide/colanic/teichoic acid biosynthesis glycosyltransferase
MFINFFKGDLKVIGFRPLSDSMLNAYPQDFVNERNKYKPGLIPPYYIDRPDTFDELIESEKKYIKLYREKKIITDINYFFKFLNSLIFKGVRSS